MVSLTSEQQNILSALQQVEADVKSGVVILEGDSEAMCRSDLVRRVCERLRINGCATTVAVYDVLRMREQGEVQL